MTRRVQGYLDIPGRLERLRVATLYVPSGFQTRQLFNFKDLYRLRKRRKHFGSSLKLYYFCPFPRGHKQISIRDIEIKYRNIPVEILLAVRI